MASSSDLGARMRDVIVETSVGDVEVDWDDIGMVELLEPPADAPGPSDPRLHGTVVTRGGHELVGWITWDLDEAFASDV
ncbi:MAG: hypothetical protein GWN82_18940, partial [Gemmatimonadetes bacterium]|nr:hypothetical protein [Gemmatimonadota bacterium]NIU32704.1 hypothetical protein [Gemmatimonadota bacterium]NIV64286.1 hypothetical protein [Gemmatimonadota bacterium]NIW67029.1 hypothetical protein [Gemmatimonadota bacterium]NIX42262.1 hypothetical protein [Gemmatimonadota bacterium]